jgi:hypothetical protein
LEGARHHFYEGREIRVANLISAVFIPGIYMTVEKLITG